MKKEKERKKYICHECLQDLEKKDRVEIDMGGYSTYVHKKCVKNAGRKNG